MTFFFFEFIQKLKKKKNWLLSEFLCYRNHFLCKLKFHIVFLVNNKTSTNKANDIKFLPVLPFSSSSNGLVCFIKICLIGPKSLRA